MDFPGSHWSLRPPAAWPLWAACWWSWQSLLWKRCHQGQYNTPWYATYSVPFPSVRWICLGLRGRSTLRSLPRLIVEYHNVSAMPSWRLRRHDPIPAQIHHVNIPRELCLQDDSKVDIFLRHTEQQGIKSPVPSIENIIWPKSYRLIQLLSVPLSPPRRTLRTTAHILMLELGYPHPHPIFPTISW